MCYVIDKRVAKPVGGNEGECHTEWNEHQYNTACNKAIRCADLCPAFAAEERYDDGEKNELPVFFKIAQTIRKLCRWIKEADEKEKEKQ